MIEHAQHAWGNFLKTVKAARGVNVLQTGQPLADELVPHVQVEDVGHLTEPTRWIQFGVHWQIIGVAAQYSRIEIRAVRPLWCTWVNTVLEPHELYVVDVHVLPAPDVAPLRTFSFCEEAPSALYRAGAVAGAPVAVAGRMTLNAAAIYEWPGRGLYVPQGRILTIMAIADNTTIAGQALLTECADPTTAP